MPPSDNPQPMNPRIPRWVGWPLVAVFTYGLMAYYARRAVFHLFPTACAIPERPGLGAGLACARNADFRRGSAARTAGLRRGRRPDRSGVPTARQDLQPRRRSPPIPARTLRDRRAAGREAAPLGPDAEMRFTSQTPPANARPSSTAPPTGLPAPSSPPTATTRTSSSSATPASLPPSPRFCSSRPSADSYRPRGWRQYATAACCGWP